MKTSLKLCTYSVLKATQHCSKLSARKPCLPQSKFASSTNNQPQNLPHWPYCARRCTYCNFNKYISKNVNHERMTACLVRELKTLLKVSGINKINSVFFGGGTPSLALPSCIAQVLDTVKSHVTFKEGSEVTLEANPTHLETSQLAEFKHAGINRLSVGIQALNDEDLKVLGRDHTVEEAVKCVEEAKRIFPGLVSVDLIFGRPGQTPKQWRTELEKILRLCDNHASLYQLTVERGTQLYKWVENKHVIMPDNDVMADMYLAAVEILKANGLERYEVSNFAKKGYESRHNQGYWNGEQYIGIGPGAHGIFRRCDESGCANREARIQTLEPDNWMFEVEKYGHATRKIVKQSQKDRLEELLCTGLRTRDGIAHMRWSSITSHCDLPSLFSHQQLQQVITKQLLVLDDRGLRATSDGLLILDTILPYVLLAFSELHSEDDMTRLS